MKRYLLWIIALSVLSLSLWSAEPNTEHNTDKQKVPPIAKEWQYHGNLHVACWYDGNVNEAPGVDGLDIVRDGTCELQGHFVAHRVYNYKTYVSLEANALFDNYFDHNSLNWNNIDILGKIHHLLSNDWILGLRGRWNHHYQPNVLNDASELLNEHFTNNFSHYEYSINPMITWKIADMSKVEVSYILSKKVYQNVEDRIPYNDIENMISLMAHHKISKFILLANGSFSNIKYKQLPPYYGGTLGALEQLATGYHKKLRKWDAMVGVGYHVWQILPTLTYTYKHQSDRFENYDSYNANEFALTVPSTWGDRRQYGLKFKASYDHTKYDNRIVSVTDNTRVYHRLYHVSITPHWKIDKDLTLDAIVSYDKRKTNVHSGRLDRKYSRLEGKVGLQYNF